MKVEPFDTQRHMAFSRRAALATGGVMLLFGGVMSRLFDLQVRRYDEFATKADNNRFKQRVIVPLRGEIVDRFGHVIATNRQNFRVLLIPEQTESVAEAISRLEAIIPLTDGQRERILREVAAKSSQSFIPIQVVDNLSWDQFTAVNFHGPRLPGIISEVAAARYYPDGEIVAPIVGHVGSADQRDLDGAASEGVRLMYLQPGFKLGKLGLEHSHDATLTGEAGIRLVEVNAAGRVIDDSGERGTPAREGDVLGLTIDAELQRKAAEILNADYKEYPEGTDMPAALAASAVVMDVLTGDVIVMASTPSFDPNAFAARIDAQTLKELSESPLHPLICKPLAGAYPPGSTFKLLTAITGLAQGIDRKARFGCSGGYNYGGRRFGCHKRSGHGSVDFVSSIKLSCDVFFYNLATRLDIDDIADTASRFGLGQTYDLGISGEAKGIVPSREWKRARYRSTPANQQWFPGETLSVAIGQGAVTSTPLQLAVMTARLATGLKVMPRLVRGEKGSLITSPPFFALPDDPEHLQIVRAGMNAVVNEGGTAARSTLKPDHLIAGKTGTSQVLSLQINPRTGRPFRNEELPWFRRDHALFVCYGPYEAPRYACAVVVEHGGSGSRSAGPRARDIMRAVLDKDPGNALRHPHWTPAAGAPDRLAAAGGA